MSAKYLDEIAKLLAGNSWAVMLIVYDEYFTVDISHKLLTDKDKIKWSDYGENLDRAQLLVASWVNSFDKHINVEKLELVKGLLTINEQPFTIVKKENTNEHVHRYLQEQADSNNS